MTRINQKIVVVIVLSTKESFIEVTGRKNEVHCVPQVLTYTVRLYFKYYFQQAIDKTLQSIWPLYWSPIFYDHKK